uniref:Putative secreted protein n=1 Tax=Anopheles triannulatus TaxID=58253 RepID=A0A2M4B2W3_9DIPT
MRIGFTALPSSLSVVAFPGAFAPAPARSGKSVALGSFSVVAGRLRCRSSLEEGVPAMSAVADGLAPSVGSVASIWRMISSGPAS